MTDQTNPMRDAIQEAMSQATESTTSQLLSALGDPYTSSGASDTQSLASTAAASDLWHGLDELA